MKIEVLYHSDVYKDNELTFVDGKSDWIDLRASRDYDYLAGKTFLVDLGLSIKLPTGFEAHLAPRSSTFRKFGVIQTNGMGVIDESYCGNGDVWKMPVYAIKDGTILKGERICQFRIMENMKDVEIVSVDDLSSEDRGGFGSTDK